MMLSIGKLKIIKSPQKWQGIFSNIHIVKDARGNEFLFKETKNKKIIFNELLAYKLASLADVKTLNYLDYKTIQGKEGLLMSYLKEAILLAKFEKRLYPNQKKELQKIILFDLFIGNKDRHAANIFVKNNNLIAFDHGRIFKSKKAKAVKFIKLDLGKKLDLNYVDKLEPLYQNCLTTWEALIKIFGFNEKDIKRIQKISKEEIEKIVKDQALREYLIFRRDHFAKIPFC